MIHYFKPFRRYTCQIPGRASLTTLADNLRDARSQFRFELGLTQLPAGTIVRRATPRD